MNHRLVVLYGMGGLSDVGRHAIQAALERRNNEIDHVTVLTKHPQLLDETNWKCGCEEPHSFSEQEKKRMTVITVKDWKNVDDLLPHFKDATAVISCLGNRQPLVGYWDSNQGNQVVIQAIEKYHPDLKRVVIMTSVGIEEDWPPMETFKPGQYILGGMFMSISYLAFRDLTKMERSYKATAEDKVDYLLVRPVGIGEDVKPVNKWVLQPKKYDDVVHFDMAKLDVARYMVEEAIHPTKHRQAVVIGSEKKEKPETITDESKNETTS